MGFLARVSLSDQLEHWLSKEEACKDLEHVDCALDTALECKAWTFLKNRVSLLLAAYSKTIKVRKSEIGAKILATGYYHTRNPLWCVEC
jgi:Rubisco LSMT substrate-binding